MAISQIFRLNVYGPLGFWTMAPLHYAAKFDPFLSLDCAPRPTPWRNPRKGRDQILPSGNTDRRSLNWIPPLQLTSCLLRRLLGGDSDMAAALSGASAGGLSMGLFYQSRSLAVYAAWKTLEVSNKYA